MLRKVTRLWILFLRNSNIFLCFQIRCVPSTTYKMTCQNHNCLSWILLTSYAVLLVLGGVGTYLSITNFGDEEMLPPTPPPPPPPQLESNATTTTTTSRPYYTRLDRSKVPEAYKEYVYASLAFANVSNDPRLYVLLPCVASVVVAALVVVCGLWSRQFFCYTFSLYNSLCLWVLTLTWIIIYQTKVAWESRMPLDNVGYVVLVHVVLMLLFSAQILLCVWELRLKKAGWPTFNYRSLFTAEALLLIARLTLTVYTLIYLSWAQVFRGFRSKEDPRYNGFYPYPNIKYPLLFTLIICTTACYNAVATLETLLSMLLGKLHTCMV
ncbi:hypothetical protein GWK47_007720 [Chionoecetes opilio]|uniref:Uncharacterized protein n=1 Tax=Chionoecetes opilio TaxID=41210 RepID=A0A8J4YBP2_CHIOP|nr:hypothetical protein GWK47_007720 [Chionoecetes opilio]